MTNENNNTESEAQILIKTLDYRKRSLSSIEQILRHNGYEMTDADTDGEEEYGAVINGSIIYEKNTSMIVIELERRQLESIGEVDVITNIRGVE